jgi:hypothetical protein
MPEKYPDRNSSMGLHRRRQQFRPALAEADAYTVFLAMPFDDDGIVIVDELALCSVF